MVADVAQCNGFERGFKAEAGFTKFCAVLSLYVAYKPKTEE